MPANPNSFPVSFCEHRHAVRLSGHVVLHDRHDRFRQPCCHLVKAHWCCLRILHKPDFYGETRAASALLYGRILQGPEILNGFYLSWYHSEVVNEEVVSSLAPYHVARCCYNYLELAVPQLAPGQLLQPVANTAAAAVIDQRQWASGSSQQLLRGGLARLAPSERHSAAVGSGAATTQAAPCLSGAAGVAAGHCIVGRRAEPEVGFECSRDRRQACLEMPAFR
jgi:hypothetical protein